MKETNEFLKCQIDFLFLSIFCLIDTTQNLLRVPHETFKEKSFLNLLN